jgi:hypothetical protein
MYYFIYETINKINEMKYRGFHMTEDINDGYLGSGTYFMRAVRKYGEENFERIILEFCDSYEEVLNKEKEYVDDNWIIRKDTYNIINGGKGGWKYVNKNKLRWNEETRKEFAIEMQEKVKSGDWSLADFVGKPTYGFSGKNHSEESKKKISENSAMTLDQKIVQKRIDDFNRLPNKHGKIMQLARLWDVSHAQVRRFLKKEELI